MNLTEQRESFAALIYRAYDPYGLTTGESVVYGSDGYSSATSWDSAGRRSSIGFGSFGYSYAWRADGRMSVAAIPPGSASYAYDTSGLLTNRVVGPRTTSLLSRDGRGRPLSLTTKINGTPIVNETLDYTGDGLIGSHTVERPDFTDSRSYFYASLSRRLIEERLNLDASTRWTNTFTFDGGTASGPGVITRLGQPQGGGSAWSGGKDSFLRTSAETNNVIRRATYGLVNGPAIVTATLDGVPMPVTVVGTNGGQWRAILELTPGTHSLTASAVHPSGQFTTNVTHSFTNTASPQTATAAYDTAGQLTQRVWKNASGTTNRVQTLSWNALGQLCKVTERDSSTNGRDFMAIYDPLGRRVQTVEFSVTNNVAYTAQPKIITVYYDPLAEFQELGVNVDGLVTWKLLGPDLDGAYGGLNGLGGCDAVVTGVNSFQPTIADARGNLLATYDVNLATYSWNPSRPTAFGAVPGYRPAPLGQGASLVQSSAWRGRWLDSIGSYNIGERPYSPENGMWLSFDSAWNGMDPTGYGAFGGDGVNYFDPDGRFGKGAAHDVGRIANGLVDGIIRVPTDTVGMAVYSLNGNPEDFQPWSSAYQGAFTQNADALQSGMFRGTGKAVVNVGTFGLYGMGEGWGESLGSGNWEAAQNGSAGALMGAPFVPKSMQALRAEARVGYQPSVRVTTSRDSGTPPSQPPQARRLALPEPRSAQVLRDSPGLAHGTDLPTIGSGQKWLRGSSADAGRVPRQVAETLAGRTFATFKDFREAFWRAIAADPILSKQFGASSLREMAAGRAPYAPATGRVGGRIKYELDHMTEIQDNGGVYDMNNLIIRTPVNHIGK